MPVKMDNPLKEMDNYIMEFCICINLYILRAPNTYKP